MAFVRHESGHSVVHNDPMVVKRTKVGAGETERINKLHFSLPWTLWTLFSCVDVGSLDSSLPMDRIRNFSCMH